MRVLYVPFFSSKNLGGCSIFNAMKIVWRGLVEANEDLFVYYMIPSESERFNTDAASYLDHPRILQVPVRGQYLQEDDLVYVPGQVWDLFNVDTGKYPIDLVVTDKPRVSLWVKMLVNNGMRAVNGNIPMINVGQYQSGSIEMGDNAGHSEEMFYAQTLGWFAGWNMWLTASHKRDALRLAAKYARPSVLKRIDERSYDGRMTLVSTERMAPYLGIEKPRDQILVNYGSRLNSSYVFRTLFEDVERLYQAGRRVRLVITSPSASLGKPGAQAVNLLRDHGMDFEVHCPCPQDKFYEIAARCHVTMYIGKNNGPSLSMREQVFLGQAVVAPNEEWARDMLPDYPWLYNSETEKQGILRRIVDRFWEPEVQDVIEKYRQHVDTHHDVRAELPGIMAFLRRVVETERKTMSTDGVLRDVFNEGGWPDRISYPDLRALVLKRTRIGRDIEANYSGTNRRNFLWAMEDVGYRDLCDGPVPTFVREEGGE